MAQDSQKLWSCVGSAGVVNLPDIGKIIFNQSVAQLGPGAPVVVTQGVQKEAAARVLPGTETVTAVIRYGVVPVDGVYVSDFPVGVVALALRLRYRDGSGQVLAKLIQVNIDSGTETTLLTFASPSPQQAASNAFQVQESPSNGIDLDFTANAYYVELTLTVTERLTVPPYPPAVSVVQLVLAAPIIP